MERLSMIFFIASARIFEVLRAMRGPAVARIEVCPGWALKRVPGGGEAERKRASPEKGQASPEAG